MSAYKSSTPFVLLTIFLLLFAVACANAPNSVVESGVTAIATTALPTIKPTSTPLPTNTPLQPTATPTPTITPTPLPTPTPTIGPLSDELLSYLDGREITEYRQLVDGTWVAFTGEEPVLVDFGSRWQAGGQFVKQDENVLSWSGSGFEMLTPPTEATGLGYELGIMDDGSGQVVPTLNLPGGGPAVMWYKNGEWAMQAFTLTFNADAFQERLSKAKRRQGANGWLDPYEIETANTGGIGLAGSDILGMKYQDSAVYYLVARDHVSRYLVIEADITHIEPVGGNMTNRSEYSSDTFSLEGVIDIYSFFNSAEIPLTYSGFELKSRLGDGPCLAEYVPVYTALCSAGPIMHSADFLDEARRADQLTSFMDESVDSEDVEQIINDALANNRVFRSPAAVLTWLGY